MSPPGSGPTHGTHTTKPTAPVHVATFCPDTHPGATPLAGEYAKHGRHPPFHA